MDRKNTSAPKSLLLPVSDIKSIARGLNEVNGSAENHFLVLGEGLQQLHTESVELTNSAERAAKTVSSDNNISQIIEDISEQILSRFSGVKTANMDILAQAKNVSLLLSKLAIGIPEIRKIDRQLWILGSNMAIQSSGSPSTKKMFGEYSEDLKKFSKNIKKLIISFKGNLEGMNESLAQVQISLRSETVRLDELISDSKKNIFNATKQLEQLLADSMIKMGIIEERSKRMTQGISDIATSIQFNDITRQQIEHVIDALEESTSSDNEFTIYKCMRVQNGQLEQVTDTLKKATTTISSSFDNIVRCGAEISAQYSGNRTESLHHSKSVDTSPFSKIKTALYELDNLLELSATLRAKSSLSIESASTASNRLSSYLTKVAEITGELNLQAINALVMSRNINDGGASLVALSKEVHALSKQSTATVGEVVRILKGVGIQTEQLRMSMDSAAKVNNSDKIKVGFDRIDEISNDYLCAVEQTSSQAFHLQQRATDISKSSLFMNELIGAIETHNSTLSASAAKLSTHVIHEGDTDTDFNVRYTMESERLIHERIHNQLAGKSSSPELPEQILPSAEDDSFGDFELF